VTGNPIFDELEHGILRAADMAGDWFHPHRASQAPAATPVNVKPTPSPEDHMSLAADFEQGYAAVKAELAKFEQALPGIVAKGRQLEESPLGQLAVRGAEAVAAGIIPPEGLALVEANAGRILDDVLALYAPQQPAQTAPAPAA
jgi:hypothetical protein